MGKNPFFSFRKGDLFAVALVAALALAAAAAFFPAGNAGENAVVQVYRDSLLIRELPLDADAEFEIGGEYTNTVRISGGRVCIESSDCPGSDCVHSGWISRPGRSIVCLPNRTEIRIAGQADVDFVVG